MTGVQTCALPIYEKTVKKMHRVVAANKEEARKEVMEWVTERFGWDDFDPGKDAQVRELLYDRDKLGLPVKARTKAGLPSADAKRLKEASETVPELAQVLRYNKYDKLDSTYCASLAEKFQRQPDGRLWMPVRINPLGPRQVDGQVILRIFRTGRCQCGELLCLGLRTGS